MSSFLHMKLSLLSEVLDPAAVVLLSVNFLLSKEVGVTTLN